MSDRAIRYMMRIYPEISPTSREFALMVSAFDAGFVDQAEEIARMEDVIRKFRAWADRIDQVLEDGP